MKRDFKIWAAILGIVMVGMGTTAITNSYVSGKRSEMAAYYGEAFSEEEAADFFDGGEAYGATGADLGEGAAAVPFAAAAQITSGETAAQKSMAAGGAELSEKLEAGAAERSEETAAITAEEGDAEDAETAGDTAEVSGENDGTGPLAEAEALTDSSGAGRFRSVPESAAGTGRAMGAVDSEENAAEEAGEPDSYGLTSGSASGSFGAVNSKTAEVVIDSAASPSGEYDISSDYREKLAEYQSRLPELDAQIERLRNSETDNTVHSVKSSAQTEQRIWERELDAVYTLLIGSLDEEAGKTLRAEQQKWIISRDQKAQEASKKNSGGSMESVEYIASIAASTRERVYELVEQYR